MALQMKVGILGAGAIGMPMGYFLAANGKVEVTYLMRQKKVTQYQGSTVILYNYDKKKIIQHSNFKCLPTEPLSDPITEDSGPYSYFDAVIITLPTDLLESDSGRAMLKGLNDRGRTDCIYLCLSPGYGMQAKVFEPCGIPKSRVCYGLPLILSHEVGMHGQPTDPKYTSSGRDEAQLAFHYLVTKGRIALLSRKPKHLGKVFSKAGKGSISAGERVLEASTVIFLTMNLMLYLQDYPKFLSKKEQSFKAGIGAFKQIMSQYKKLGGMMKFFVGGNMMKIIDKGNRWSSKPLNLDFLKHHHGGKVKDQNVQVLEMYIEPGKAMGKPVDQIEEFVKLCKEHTPPPQA